MCGCICNLHMVFGSRHARTATKSSYANNTNLLSRSSCSHIIYVLELPRKFCSPPPRNSRQRRVANNAGQGCCNNTWGRDHSCCSTLPPLLAEANGFVACGSLSYVGGLGETYQYTARRMNSSLEVHSYSIGRRVAMYWTGPLFLIPGLCLHGVWRCRG